MLRGGAKGAAGSLFAGVLAALVLAAPAAADPAAPLGHAGRWITDANGRVVIMHGLNMVYKAPPYAPSAAGFGDDDAKFLADNGFNTVRLGIIYQAVEPSPGAYDDAYIDDIARTEKVLGDHGVFSMLDYHQDLFNERFHGEGWPDWAVQDDGLPNQPDLGFPGNYVGMPALSRAFDHFWANDPGPGGIGLRDRYVAALAHVARRFAGSQTTIGYDLMNEPFPGTAWPTCVLPLIGCPLFDAGQLAAFSRAAAAAIRAVEPQKLVWYEPNVLFDFGAGSSHPALGDPQGGISYHDYCLPGAFGLPIPVPGCELLEDNVMTGADQHAAANGEALMLSEFGATPDLAVLRRMADAADRHMVSWQEWHYCGCSDPTTQAGPGDGQALVRDPELPPSGDNVLNDKLAVLSRPYPQVVAGTPTAYSYDSVTQDFALTLSTARAGGGGRFASQTDGSGAVTQSSPATEVFLPPVHYPTGYDVDLEGAVAASAPGARTLRVIACPGATDVRVAVSLAGQGQGNGPDCALAPAAEPGAATPRPRGACALLRRKLRHLKRKLHSARGHRKKQLRRQTSRTRRKLARLGC